MEHRFRIFISYASADIELVEDLDKALSDLDHVPVWSKGILPGTPFTDEIKGMIATAHVFMPLITEASANTPWVNQETGYAMALNIPVLPVAIKTSPETTLPAIMISQLQAIFIKDRSDLRERVSEINFEQLVLPRPSRPTFTTEIADWPEKRAELMSRYANLVTQISGYGEVRQRGALSSFCIPNKDIDDFMWKHREGKCPRSRYYLNLLREERMALERHARESSREGSRKNRCYLIIDPAVAIDRKIGFHKLGKYVPWARLYTLLEFLKSVPDDDKVRVVITPRGRDGNLTIIGDWFVAESLTPRTGEGYKQTIFSWYAPTVLRWISKFDQEFKEICEQQNIEPEESLRTAIRKIEDMIRDLPRPKMPEDESENLNAMRAP